MTSEPTLRGWGPTAGGRFANPILPGDFSDPDVIRTGDDFWMITSTFEYSPGMAVLHSRDLVTWRYAGHCIRDVTALGPSFSQDVMGCDGRGVYAGSIREHDGLFYVYFTTLDDGLFLVTAPHPTGPWSDPHLVWDEPYWDDPCPLWEPDGTAWLVASRPGQPVDDGWMTYIMPLAADGLSVASDRLRVLDSTWSSEGNKIDVIDGRYYVLHNEVASAGNRIAVIMRADALDGPWEKRTLLLGQGPDRDREPNQGALVDTADGRWFFVTHHGRTGYTEGRPVSVVPIEWVDGWPVAAMTWSAELPLPHAEAFELQTSDRFEGAQLGPQVLGPQWEWRYQHDPAAWSLEPGGGIRLRARPLLHEGDPRTARNTLTQRQLGAAGRATATLDTSGLADGSRAGLAHFGGEFSSIQVAVDAGVRTLRILRSSRPGPARVEHSRELRPGHLIALRTDIDDVGYATFSCSVDSGPFEPFGDSYRPSFANYRGNRLALQCYTESGGGGEVLVREFEYVVGARVANG